MRIVASYRATPGHSRGTLSVSSMGTERTYVDSFCRSNVGPPTACDGPGNETFRAYVISVFALLLATDVELFAEKSSVQWAPADSNERSAGGWGSSPSGPPASIGQRPIPANTATVPIIATTPTTARTATTPRLYMSPRFAVASIRRPLLKIPSNRFPGLIRRCFSLSAGAIAEGRSQAVFPHDGSITSRRGAGIPYLRTHEYLYQETSGSPSTDHRGRYWAIADAEHALASAGLHGSSTADDSDGGFSDEDDADLATTPIHGYAHALPHGDVDDATEHSKWEVEAEAVAYVVGHHFDLDTSNSAFYLAAWDGDDSDAITDRLGRISRTAERIIDAVESTLGK